jgi:hypothetical protein
LKYAIATSFGLVSILAMSCSVVVGFFLILAPSGGGFFPDLGVVVGILVLAAGNLVSCISNGICWAAGKRRHWLAVVFVLQAFLTLLGAGWIVLAA